LATVDNANNVDLVSNKLKELDVSTQSFKSIFESILKIFSIVATVLGAFGLIALIVAAIGIINTMVMATYERTREIGVMRATGASQKAVSQIFTWEAGLIGLLGGVIGIGIGLCGQTLIGFILNNYVLTKIDVSSDPILASGAKNLFSTPLWLPLGIMGFTMLLGLFAGLLPAQKAARLDPVEALKYE